MEALARAFSLDKPTSLKALEVDEQVKLVLKATDYGKLPEESKEKVFSLFLGENIEKTEEFTKIIGTTLSLDVLNALTEAVKKSAENNKAAAYFIIRSALAYAYDNEDKAESEWENAVFASLAAIQKSEIEAVATAASLIVFKHIAKNDVTVSNIKALAEIANNGDFSEFAKIKEFDYGSFVSAASLSLSEASSEERIQYLEHASSFINKETPKEVLDKYFGAFQIASFDNSEEEICKRAFSIAKKDVFLGAKISKPAAKNVVALIFGDGKINEDKANTFMQFLSGQEKDDVNEMLDIKNEMLLYYVVPVYQKDSKVIELIQYLTYLLNNSFANIYAMHRARIELALINIINNDEDDNVSVFAGTAIAFLNQITQVVSSPDVVKATLGLLSPNGSKKMIKMQSLFMSLFSETIMENIQSPRGFLILNEESPAIKLSCSNKSVIGKNFLIEEWIKIPIIIPETYEITLFSIQQNDKELIKVSVKNYDIIVKIDSTEYTAKICSEMNKWNLFSVEFIRAGQAYSIRPYLNGSPCTEEVINTPIVNFTGSSAVDVIFAGKYENLPIEPLLGPFVLSEPKDKNEYLMEGINGPRRTLTTKTALVEFSYGENNIINAVTDVDTDTDATLIGQKQQHDRLFTDILVDYFGIQSIIPLFSPTDDNIRNDESKRLYALTVMEAFLTTLKHVTCAASEFLANGGFKSISYLLAKQNPLFISYELYKNVYTFFCEIDNQELRFDALKNFLLNFSLWVHAPGEEQALIFRHWSRQVYANYFDLAVKARSFEEVLLSLRTMFWYTEVESDIILYGENSEAPRPKDLPIKTIRSAIIQVAYHIAINEFSEEQLRALIAHVVTVSDSQQVCDLLVFIKLLAVSEDRPYSKAADSLSLFNVLHCLLNNEDDNIIFNVLDVFATLHMTDYMPTPKAIVHTNVLMDLIPQICFNIDMYSLLIPFVIRFPSFLPLLFYAVTRFDHEDIQNRTMKHLKADTNFSASKNWLIWPLVAAMYKGGEFQNFIMELIANSTETNWGYTFCAIDVIGRALGISTENAKNIFLNQLCKSLLDKPLLGFEAQHAFFDIACFFIFFRPQVNGEQKLLEPLDQAFSESCFAYEPQEEEPEHQITKEQITKTKLFENIKKIAEGDLVKYSYGLRINKEGKWLDADLALNLCKQARRTKCQTFHNISCIFAAFALSTKYDEALEQIGGLNSAKVADDSFLAIIQRRDKRFTGIPRSTDCFDKLIQITEKYNQDLIELSKTVAEKFTHFYEKSIDAKDTIFGIADDDLTSSIGKTIGSYRNIVETKNISAKKHVNQIVSSMSYKGGPFECEHKEDENCEYSILPRACSNFCPMKVIKVPKTEETAERKNTDEECRKTEETYHKFLEEKYVNKVPKLEPENVGLAELVKITIPGFLVRIDSIEKINLVLLPDHFEIHLSNDVVKTFDSKNVIKVMFRAFQGHPTGLEIFTSVRKTYLIQLQDYNSFSCLEKISSLPGFDKIEVQNLPPAEYIDSLKLQEKWVNRDITTFEYLSKLNDVAGRSFNCLSMYPIMPNVSNNRDLSKPMENSMSKRNVLRLLATREPYKALSKKFNGGFIDEETLTDVSNIKSELTPEFFCSTYVLGEDVKIPAEYETSLDYVIAMRRLLETDEVAKNIPTWIDMIFGVNQGNEMIKNEIWTEENLKDKEKRINIECQMEFKGIHPMKLFAEPHPSRIEASEKGLKSVTTTKCGYSGIEPICAISDSHMPNELASSTIICKDGSLFHMVLHNSSGILHPLIKAESVKLHITDHVTVNNFSDCGSGMFYGAESGATYLITSNEMVPVYEHHSQVKCLAADNDHLIVCYDTITANILRAKEPFRLCYTIHSFRGSIECCAISSMFNLAVIGVTDKTINIVSIATGVFDKTIKTPYTPRKVLVTNNFGFIVVFSADGAHGAITVYAQDGKVVKNVEVPFTVKHWCLAETKEMFEGICVCTADNRIYTFDAVLLDINDPLYSSEEEVEAIFAPEGKNVVTFLTKDGTFVSIPY